MAIKKGDTIQVRSGKDRGKTGKVLNVSHDRGTVLVEGINVYVKHVKPKREGEKGQKVTLPRAIAISRALLHCSSCGRGVRTGIRMDGDKKVRYCKRCDAAL